MSTWPPVASRRRFLVFVVALLAGCAAPSIVTQPERRGLHEPGQQVWAYHAYWMADAWQAYDLRTFGRVLFFDLAVARDGHIGARNGWPSQWEALRRAAQEARVPLDPVVSILDTPTFVAVFSDPAASARLAAEVVALGRESGGVHLDMEVFDAVDARVAEAFSAFLQRVRRELDAPPRATLTAFVPLASTIYGERELALLDAVVAQGYDAHWQDTKRTGPIALLEGPSPAAWKTAGTGLAARGVSPRRIVFSTPLYGYEWPAVSADPGAATTGAGAIITYAPAPGEARKDFPVDALARVTKYGRLRDPASGAPYYAFRERSGWRQGWFDDMASLAPRLDYVEAGDFRGVAVWTLGYDGGTIVEAIGARFRAGSGRAADASRR